ncbi:MAG: hypothetical protein ACP5NI_09575, partial [Acetobacteraceae bacterium]
GSTSFGGGSGAGRRAGWADASARRCGGDDAARSSPAGQPRAGRCGHCRHRATGRTRPGQRPSDQRSAGQRLDERRDERTG